MNIYTTDTIPGKEIEALGMVKGNVVQSKHIGRDIMAGLKTIVGGEIAGYTQMLAEARNIATNRMIKEAEILGADAIVAVRYSSASIMDGAAEMMAYGTAIRFKDGK